MPAPKGLNKRRTFAFKFAIELRVLDALLPPITKLCYCILQLCCHFVVLIVDQGAELRVVKQGALTVTRIL